MKYDAKELKLLNMKKVRVYKSSPYLRDGLSVFEIETQLSEEEKIKFIDEMKDGVASYMLAILKKWEVEHTSLPKDQYGKVKTVSKKGFLSRNDPREIIKRDPRNIGTYWLFKQEFKTMSLICPGTGFNNYSLEYTGESVVHQWFHDLCMELYVNEKKYFEKTDTRQLKIKKLKEYGSIFNTYFDDDVLHDLIWNSRHQDISEQALDVYLEAYQELQNQITCITKELETKIASLE